MVFRTCRAATRDEHDADEPAMLKKIDDKTVDADARIRIEDLNRQAGLSLPEDAGYETLAGFNTTHGARVMLSTPQAIVTSASPTATVRDAPKIASMPLPHNRLTVAAGMVVGSPANSSAMRPTLRLSSPA